MHGRTGRDLYRPGARHTAQRPSTHGGTRIQDHHHRRGRLRLLDRVHVLPLRRIPRLVHRVRCNHLRRRSARLHARQRPKPCIPFVTRLLRHTRDPFQAQVQARSGKAHCPHSVRTPHRCGILSGVHQCARREARRGLHGRHHPQPRPLCPLARTFRGQRAVHPHLQLGHRLPRDHCSAQRGLPAHHRLLLPLRPRRHQCVPQVQTRPLIHRPIYGLEQFAQHRREDPLGAP